MSMAYIEIARKEKNEFNRDFSQEPKVSSFHDICEVFCHNRLLEYKKRQDKVSKGELGQNWLERLDDLIESTNSNCQRIKQYALNMSDKEKTLMKTINELTGKFKTKEFDWVVQTIIQFKDNIDHSI